jgi:hypothetical protein
LLGRQRLRQAVEAVAFAGDGDDKSRPLGIGLDLSSQFSDQHVDAAVEWLETPVGEGVQQRIATDPPSRSRHEHPEHRELGMRQRNRLAGFTGEHAGVQVEDKAGEANERCDFQQGLDGAESRCAAHRARPPECTVKYAALLSLQVVYQVNISTLHHRRIFVANSAFNEVNIGMHGALVE